MLTAAFAILPGIGAMDNVHPLFVHYPIALFTAFFVAEFLGVIFKKDHFRSAASFTLYLGNLAALAAVLAGFHAASTVEHNEAVHIIMERHEAFGVTVLILATILSIWRLYTRRKFSPRAQIVHLVAAFILTVIIAFGADLGGLMVFKYGVGGQAVRNERARLLDSGEGHMEEALNEEGESGHDHGNHHHHGGE
ncbi:MAG: DUF2231 domain-containing protein [Thermodesulfobacteriota bacterium]